MRGLLTVATAVLFLAACGEGARKLAAPEVTTLPNGAIEVKNTGPSAWADTTGWKLVELFRVGGAGAEGTPGELVDPQSITLDAAGGLYVVDQKPAVIKQFNPGGAYVRSFGREGGGPGEFEAASIATAPGVLVVHDPSSSRTSVFDSTGTFLRSWNSACCYYGMIGVSRDGVIAVPTSAQSSGGIRPGEAHFVRHRLDGSLVDTLHIAGPDGVDQPQRWTLSAGGGSGSGPTMMMTIPLTPAVRSALDPTGGAVIGWSGAYRFISTRTGLDTTQIVTLETAPAEVTDSRRIRIRDSMAERFGKQFDRKIVDEAFKLSDIPSTAPYFESLAVDGQENRWIRRDDGGNPAAAQFDVFDSTGAYLGAVPVPQAFGRWYNTSWGSDRVATIAEDAEGLPVVVVYGIERR